MKHISAILLLTLVFSAATVSAQTAASAPAEARQQTAAIAKLNRKLLAELGDSVVRVETFLKTSPSGEMPEMTTRYKCPNCDEYHTAGVDDLIKENRPVSQPGFVVAPDEVLATDLYLLPEWVARTEVIFRGKAYSARPIAFFPEQESCLLKVENPPGDWKPLQFDRNVQGRLYQFFLVDEEGIPVAGVAPDAGESVFRNLETGRDYQLVKPNTLLVDNSGKVATVNMSEQFPLDADRLAPPAEWKRQSAEDRRKQLETLTAFLKDNIYPVRIRLASQNSNTPQIMIMRRNDGKDKNEFDAIAIKLTDGKLLINLRLSPDQTARLERIFVLHGDKIIDCSFAGSLNDFGALLAKPDSPLPGKGIALYDRRPGALYGQQLQVATIRNFDGKLQIKTQPTRLIGFETGHNNMLVPVPLYSSGENGYLFTPDHRLLLLPLTRRDNLDRYSSDHPDPVTGERLAALLQSDRALDANNVPRKAGDRNQNAWLGADFQRLTPELARANNASSQTGNGNKGLLITNVLPDSPAAKIGLKSGDVLLYLRPENSQQRMELNGYDFSMNEYLQEFPWAQYDEIPERYFDQIPTPWPPVENELNTRLTKLGIGNRIVLGVIVDGKLEEKQLTVTRAPVNFSNAPRFTDKNIGLTVVTPTFEVRNYFRMKAEDPGMLIAKIRPGSPASVAGLKPYEIIVSVDDQPVKSLEEFEKLIKDKHSFNLAVRRFAVTRVVKFQLPSSAPETE